MSAGSQDQVASILEAAAEATAEVTFLEEPLSLEPESVLLGEGAPLDSMGFVNFIVAVEDAIKRETGLSVNLHEELAGGTGGDDSTLSVSDLTGILTKIIREGNGG